MNADNIIVWQKRPGLFAVVEIDDDENILVVIKDNITYYPAARRVRNHYRNLNMENPE